MMIKAANEPTRTLQKRINVSFQLIPAVWVNRCTLPLEASTRSYRRCLAAVLESIRTLFLHRRLLVDPVSQGQAPRDWKMMHAPLNNSEKTPGEIEYPGQTKVVND